MPLAVASVDQWQWHLSKVPLVVAACAAWRGAEQKKSVQVVNAMPCKYRWAAGRTRDYEYIKVTCGIKISGRNGAISPKSIRWEGNVWFTTKE